MKIGIVGAGYWGKNLIRNFDRVADEIVACDLRQEILGQRKSEMPSLQTTTNLEELLKDESIDAIAIATQPLSTHYLLGKQVLEAKKHLFVEKPMASSTKEAQELIEIANKNERIINVDHTFEYSAPVTMIKDIIGEGRLGKILTITMQRLNLGKVQPDFNVIWDLCPHDFSMINYWLEQMPQTMYATGSSNVDNNNVEDDAHLFLKYGDGGPSVQIHESWLFPQKIRKITIVGSKRMLVYDDIEPENKIAIYDKGVESLDSNGSALSSFGGIQYSYRQGDILMPKINFVEPLLTECQEFVSAIQNNGRTRTDGNSGLKVVSLLEAADKSLKEKSEIKL